MGRRSDHTREELEQLIVGAGHTLLAEVGYQRFSAREVAKRIGYSVGTIYNVFDSLDDLMLAINGRTFLIWAETVARNLEKAGPDRIAVLVAAYFEFATSNRNLWMAIYDHRLPVGVPRRVAPSVSQLSSTRISLCLSAMARSRSQSGTPPTRFGTRIALVLGVIISSTLSRSIW